MKKLLMMIVCTITFYNNIYSAEFNHKSFDELLKLHVTPDGVNYNTLIKDKEKLKLYLNSFKSADPNGFNKSEKLAFYINAYNAFTLMLILDNLDKIKSIKDISTPWDLKICNIGGELISLNDIEHNILRKKFDENRIHFAINCASISCPLLQNFAFMPDKIESQLEDSTRNFINSPRGSLLKNNSELFVSKIFDWYKSDFGDSNESVLKFIQKYSENDKVKDLTIKKTSIQYFDYNWSLNISKP